MPSASNAELQYETAQTSSGSPAALTDSGDHTVYTSAASLWSKKSGYKAEVRPNGIVSGCVVTPAASGSNDVVDVSAGTAYIQGVLTAISADTDVSITRGVSTDTHSITSITITSAGAIAAVAGTDNTAFSETRAATGGPPLIPVDSIELAQVRTTSVTAAAVVASEILSVIGTHREAYNYPGWTEQPESGKVTLNAALPAIHTGPITKKVYATWAVPVFLSLDECTDFVPPEESYSVTSTQIYQNKTIGSSSKSLGQGSFKAYLKDGVLDDLVANKGQELWFKFFPDRTMDQHILCNGALGITRSFPASDNISSSCTISSQSAALERAS